LYLLIERVEIILASMGRNKMRPYKVFVRGVSKEDDELMPLELTRFVLHRILILLVAFKTVETSRRVCAMRNIFTGSI